MPLKSRLPPRNRATATSSAEISAVLARDPPGPPRGQSAGREAALVRGAKSRRPAAIRSTAFAATASAPGM
jgi:hypothetical protein